MFSSVVVTTFPPPPRTCWVDAAPALVAMTMYLVAGGEGCVGVPGRVDIRVRELGTLIMLGVRDTPDPPSPLWVTVSVGRGYG